MALLRRIPVSGHEEVIVIDDAASGLRGFIAIHSTRLGPAAGGIRLWKYASEEDCLADALRLSRGMTYKCALAELDCGGAKTVLMAHPNLKRAAGFQTLAQIIDSLGGRYLSGPDVGVTSDDLELMAGFTRFVTSDRD